MIEIEIIKNEPIDSNCYVITVSGLTKCIVVDPGTEYCNELMNFLLKKNLKIDFILLTHEHFDHIWGCNYLKEKFDCKIVCSELCSSNIVLSKRNLSVFFNQIGFITSKADILLESVNWELNWNYNKIIFFNTPGHSNCSICFSIGNNLFTGDTMIKGLKTVTKISGGNRNLLEESLNQIFFEYNENTIIYPGHGDVFTLNETSISDFKS